MSITLLRRLIARTLVFLENCIVGIIVETGYDKVAEEFLKTRDKYVKDIFYLEKLNILLEPNSLILDLGCGAGEPIDKFFINKGHKVVGIDISEKQVARAKKNVPQAEFLVGDISKLKTGEYHVNAVVSFYVSFHIPRTRHYELLQKINSFLPRGGYLLATMGSRNISSRIVTFWGVKMYWSQYEPAVNRKIIKQAGFKILLDEIDTSSGEKHQMILAQKL